MKFLGPWSNVKDGRFSIVKGLEVMVVSTRNILPQGAPGLLPNIEDLGRSRTPLWGLLSKVLVAAVVYAGVEFPNRAPPEFEFPEGCCGNNRGKLPKDGDGFGCCVVPASKENTTRNNNEKEARVLSKTKRRIATCSLDWWYSKDCREFTIRCRRRAARLHYRSKIRMLRCSCIERKYDKKQEQKRRKGLA